MSLEISTETTFLLDMVNFQFGPEIHTSANAASDPNGNEANATTGWSQSGLTGTGANVFESQASVKEVGSYALHTDANDTPTSAARIFIAFTVVDTATYLLTGDWRHIGSGDNWRCVINGNNAGEITSADTTFEDISLQFVQSGGTSCELQFIEVGVGNNGGVYADNISLRRVL